MLQALNMLHSLITAKQIAQLAVFNNKNIGSRLNVCNNILRTINSNTFLDF